MPLLTRADKHFSNMSSLIELNTVQNPVLESTWCPQRKPERQKMPATTHVLYQDHHYAPGDWLAATDHRSMTHCVCCKLLSSVNRQISLRTRDQHSTPIGVYVVTLERLMNFSVGPAHHGMKIISFSLFTALARYAQRVNRQSAIAVPVLSGAPRSVEDSVVFCSKPTSKS